MDVISDFLTIIRNGVMASKSSVLAPHSQMREKIAGILKEEGFIKDVAVVEVDGGHKALKIYLKFVGGESAIHEIKRVSKQSLRQYIGVDAIKPVIGKLGLSILTTSKGIMSHKQAKKLRVGGEIICTVW